MTKICTKCRIEKSLSSFSRCRKGRASRCKSCINLYAAAYRAANKEKIKKKQAKYYLIHRDFLNQCCRVYSVTHKDTLRKTKKIYADANKDKKEKYRNSSALYKTYACQISFAEQVFESEGGLLLVPCTYCGKLYTPRVRDIGSRVAALNGKVRGECRLYCSGACKQACPSYNQEKFWKSQKKATSREVSAHFRQLVLERDNWICQRCGAGIEAGLHVHHIEGAVQQPGIANDLENGITLCKECHKYVHSQDGCRYHDLKCSD
jgi:hypothetical protein